MDTPKILIVEDDVNLCKSLKFFLVEERFQVKAYTNPLAALEILKQEEFDLIISDIKMPDMDGITLLSRAKHEQPHCEVILITAYASRDTAIEALNRGAFFYLIKPFEPLEALGVIQQALSKRRLTIENQRLLEELTQANQELAQKTQELSKALKDLQTAQAALVEKERLAAAGEIVVSINHSINNPLTAVCGLLELMDKEKLTPPSRELYRQLKEEVKRIQKVTEKLKDLKSVEKEDYIPGIKMIKLE